MNKPIAIFYHSVFFLGEPPEPSARAISVTDWQMKIMKGSGLEESAKEIYCGINGGEESEPIAEALLPKKALKIYHGLQSHGENRTVILMQEWALTHPDWLVLYFHPKGCTHAPGEGGVDGWRDRMMYYCVQQWRQCVHDLRTFEAVGCHWMGDGVHNYFAGTFFWVRSEFWATIPSIMNRARIKESGIDPTISRHEAEVVIGCGPRLPVIKDYFPGHPMKFM